jgi:hypothetical protein
MLTRRNWSIERALGKDLSESETAATRLLPQAVDALANSPQGRLAVKELVPWQAEDDDVFRLVLALEAAELWGLVAVNAAQPSARGRLLPIRLAGKRDELLSTTIRLTEAGLIWHYATAAMDAERQRSRRMNAGGRDESINVHVHGGDVMAPLIAARGDVKGNRMSAVNTVRLSDGEVIRNLQTLLASSAIPWQQPAYAEAQMEIERAVERKNPHDPRLRRVMQFLLSSSGQVVLGILGNYATDGLHTFFS